MDAKERIFSLIDEIAPDLDERGVEVVFNFVSQCTISDFEKLKTYHETRNILGR